MAYFGISLKNNEEQQEFARLICTTDKQIIFCTGKAVGYGGEIFQG